MKKMIIVLIVATLLCSVSTRCKAAESNLFDDQISRIENSIDDNTNNEMNSVGVTSIRDVIKGGLDSGKIWQYLLRLFTAYSNAPMAALLLMTAVLLLASVAESYTYSLRYTHTRDIMGIVISLFLASVIVSPVSSLIEASLKVIQGACAVMTIYLPVMAGMMLFSGRAIFSGGYYAAVMTVSQVLSKVCASVLAPLLNIFLSLSVSAGISSRAHLGGLIEMVSKGFKYGITFIMSIFTAVVGLNGALSGAADSVANKAARFGLSSFIPLIGACVSEAYGALQNSVGVLRSGAGVFVIIAVFVSFAPIIIRSVLWSISLGLAKCIGDMLSVSSSSAILNALSQFISALRALMIAVMTVFIISSSVMLITGGRS